MRIKDVIISEAPAAPAAPAAASGTPTTAAKGGGVFPTAKADIIAWQKANGLKPDGLIGDKTYAAMSAADMKAPPGFQKVPNKAKAPAAKPAAPAANPNQAAIDASNKVQADQTAAVAAANQPAAEPAKPSDGSTAEIDRLQQLGGINAQVANPFAPKPPAAAAPAAPAAAEPAAEPAAAGQRPGGIAFNQDAGTTSGQAAQAAPGQRPGGIAFNQDAGSTSGQAAQAAAPAPEAPATAAPAPAAAPAAPSTVAPVVKTGTGGTLTTRDGKPVTSRSDDEIAWAQKNPYQPYPGPGWQEKQKAQGDQNAAAVKGFLNKINPFAKKAAPAAPGTPAAGSAFNQGAPVTMETKRGDDELLEKMRTIAGLR